ncbi:MAG TPA: hypothetical protein VF146_09225, partial [Bryobacteraceae bacterium]
MFSVSDQLELRFGLAFEDLYQRDGLLRVDAAFLEHLALADAPLHGRLLEARTNPGDLAPKDQSELIIALAPHVEDFLGELFGITGEIEALQKRHNQSAPFFAFKRKFIQKRAISGVTREQAAAIDGPALARELESFFREPLTERSFYAQVSAWLENEAAHTSEIQSALRYAAWAALSPAGIERHHRDVLFKVAHKLDPLHLVPVESIQNGDGIANLRLPQERWRYREGFQLTDRGMALAGALDQANYCIKCHNQGKDSCSTGLKEKSGEFKKTIFGVTLAGCPLEEKISELNVVKQSGHTVGALAIVTIDNPMAAATGHRICNDCMKACIYQKQDPVDIPQIETRTLKDVLELPWGFEIYSLLTRWNPLNFARP